jgi:ribosomal protein S18 acetylase RimI-like enzyme
LKDLLYRKRKSKYKYGEGLCLVNINNKVLDQHIILKKYINEKEHREIKELEDICIKEDKVNLKLELEYRTQIYKDYEKSLNDINEFLYYINDDLIGYIGISSFGANVAEINGIVHPSFRRKGIFTKLIKLVIDECKKRNFNEILLLCDDKSTSAIEFIKITEAIYSFSECRMKCLNYDIRENNKDISLVKCKNEDVDQIENLNKVFFGYVSSELILPEDEEKNNTITYLIQLYKKTIGKIKVSKDKNAAFISGFGIIPELRGKGYGRQILMEVLSNLNKECIYDVELDVEVKNKNALNLYKSCGFKEESVMNYYKVNI